VISVVTKKAENTILFPSSFVDVVGSSIRDPGSEIRDSGWVNIRIRDSGFEINTADLQKWNVTNLRKCN
jgi:hypothetical protein